MSGLVRKLFSEEDLLELFEDELMHSKNRKRSIFEEMEEEEEEGEEEGNEKKGSSVEDTIEELDIDSMEDADKIELVKEILSSCKDMDCKDIIKSLNKLMDGGESEGDSEEEGEYEEEEEE